MPRRRRHRRRDGTIDRPAAQNQGRPPARHADSRRHSFARDAAQPVRRGRVDRADSLPAHHRARPRARSGAAHVPASPTAARLEGAVLGEGFDDLQLRTADERVSCCGATGDACARSRSETGWPTYNGDPGGNRYTTLTQIDKTNVARLAPRWMFTMPNAGALQGTPVVVDGIMYVTAPNECFALDAGSGRQIWHYQRPRTPGPSAGGTPTAASRSRAIACSWRPTTRTCIALNRFTGELLWDTDAGRLARELRRPRRRRSPAGNLVISGVAGGEHGANGFVAALDQATGKEVWRFWTVPKPGEPGSETWQGQGHRITAARRPGSPAATIPSSIIVYWPIGNPSKEYNGDDRQGDNLYANSHPGARSQDRHAEVVLPVHAARSLGLGRDADVRARRRRLAGAAAQADAARRAATDSSTCSIAPTARCCWPSRS